MFELIKTSLRIRKLQKIVGKIVEDYRPEFDQLKKENKDTAFLEASMSFEIDEVQEEIACRLSQLLLNQARLRHLPIPEYRESEGIWKSTLQYMHGRMVLTDKGQWQLKCLIREDQKEFREGVIMWVTVITGLLGTFIGVVSILKN